MTTIYHHSATAAAAPVGFASSPACFHASASIASVSVSASSCVNERFSHSVPPEQVVGQVYGCKMSLLRVNARARNEKCFFFLHLNF